MERGLRELNPATRWLALEREVHDVVDSTNLLAETRVLEGIGDGALILADRQTAGRGRLGRSFFSPGGRSLYMSLVLRAPMPTERVPLHVFAAASAVAETCAACLPAEAGVRIEIKWPNDVLLDARKVAGINLPVVMGQTGPDAAILGIGLNVNTLRDEFPPELRETATSLRLAAGGGALERVGVAEDLLARLEPRIEALRSDRAASVLEGWSKYFRMVGRDVTVGGPGVPERIEGIVEGVDSDGALRLRTSTGTQRIVAGDVSLRPPKPGPDPTPEAGPNIVPEAGPNGVPEAGPDGVPKTGPDGEADPDAAPGAEPCC